MRRHPPYTGWNNVLKTYRSCLETTFFWYVRGEERQIRNSLDNLQAMTEWIKELLSEEDKRRNAPWWKRWFL